jgi:Coenzyme PQQ synthesis protein D (PqqD)
MLQEEPDGWALLFNSDSAGALALNPTGVAVWKLVNGRRSVTDIAAALRRQFGSVPESMESDVTELLRVLTEEGLVGHEFIEDGQVGRVL